MKNKEISFIPIGNYRLKVIGACLLILGIGLKLLSTINSGEIFHGFILTEWIIVAGLSFINFSKEKNESSQSTINRLISFKAAGMFAIGFILAFELIAAIFKLKFFLPALTIALAYNVVFLVNYVILKFTNNNVEIVDYKEITVAENYKLNPKLYVAWFVLSAVALLTIFFISKP